jgi:ribosomal-protein-alanine N-acetyltransferase
MISLTIIDEDNFQYFRDDILEIEKASFPSPWSPNAFREEINKLVSHLWGLIMNEELVGYICFWEFAGELHLMNIAVHPDRRGRGLGRYMLNGMIEAGISKGSQIVWLEVRPSNLAARKLYEKTCFRETGRRQQYYKDTHEDAIVMSLLLHQKKGHLRGVGRTLHRTCLI